MDTKYKCGCWKESMLGKTLSIADPMPLRSDFTENNHFLMHYCRRHWPEYVAGGRFTLIPLLKNNPKCEGGG